MAIEPLEFSRRRRDGGSLDEVLRPQGALATASAGQHKLDSEEARRELRQMLEWYYYEKERQSLNRLDMAMDCDFYDSLQWDPEDAAVLRELLAEVRDPRGAAAGFALYSALRRPHHRRMFMEGRRLREAFLAPMGQGGPSVPLVA